MSLTSEHNVASAPSAPRSTTGRVTVCAYLVAKVVIERTILGHRPWCLSGERGAND